MQSIYTGMLEGLQNENQLRQERQKRNRELFDLQMGLARERRAQQTVQQPQQRQEQPQGMIPQESTALAPWQEPSPVARHWGEPIQPSYTLRSTSGGAGMTSGITSPAGKAEGFD
jgi:hypothetical protein